MKKRISMLLAFLLVLPLLPARVSGAADISASSAIVMEPYTGAILYEKNADSRMLIASTTKIMTALVVLEHCRLNETLVATEEEAGVEGSSMLLAPGETYTVEEVLYGLLLASGNDAAAALADHCAGGMEAFAELMNQKCRELGLTDTHFENAHGLDAPEHYSTARELALITAAAMENPMFCRIFSTVSYTVHDHTYVNHNQLLTSCEGCIGGKTGYTMAAGRILVSCVEREGMRLICVTISDPDDWADHAALYDALFAAWRYIPLPERQWQQLETISGAKSCARLTCAEPGLVVSKQSQVRLNVRLPRFVFAPVVRGDLAGTIDVVIDGAVDRTVDVRYGETVPLDASIGLSGWERFRRLWFRAGGVSGVYYVTG